MLSAPRTRWTLALVGIALFMVTLDNLVVTTALPSIHAALGGNISTLEWTVNAYTLTYAVLLLTGAALGDRFGRRRVFVFGLFVFSFASAAAALAPSTSALIAARAVQGAGAAMVTPLTLTLLTDAVPGQGRGLVLGLWSGIAGLGVALGPVVGGAIVDGISWQWIFWINVPIGLAVAPLAARHLVESHGPDRELDLPGLVLAGAGLLGVVYGIVRGHELGWTSTTIVASLAAGAALLVAFLVWESRTAHPMLPLRFFRSRAFSATNGVSLAMYFGTFGVVFLLAQYFQVAQHLTPLQSGVRTLAWTGMPMLVAPLAGLFSDRFGSRPFLVIGLMLQAAALVWMHSVIAPGNAYVTVLPGLVMGGVGMGLVFAPAANAVVSAVGPHEVGKASGATNTIRELGGVLGIAVLASVFSATGSYATPAAFTAGLKPALLVAAAVLVTGALAGLLVPGRRSQRAVEEPPCAQIGAAEPVAA